MASGKNAQLENVLFDGIFYCCDQDDITYQRARSKSQYKGVAIELTGVVGKNVWMKNVFISRVKDVICVSGAENADFTLNIENFYADDYGTFAQIGQNCTLYIDGEVQQSRV